MNEDEATTALMVKGGPELRAYLQDGGRLWNTETLQQDFEVTGFQAPYVGVIRKSDRKVGSLKFIHDPRWYFDFQPDHI